MAQSAFVTWPVETDVDAVTWPSAVGGGGADPVSQLFLPTALTESDPNGIASAATLDTLSDRVTMAAAGTARTTPDVAACWYGLIRDMTGTDVSSLVKGDLIRIACRIAAVLPTDVGVFAIIYDGAGGAPSATDEGIGVVMTEGGTGTMGVQAFRSIGAGWARNTRSTPRHATARIGSVSASDGASAVQQLNSAGSYDGAYSVLEGTTATAANVTMTNVDTFGIGVTWEGVGGSNGVTIDLAGIASVLGLGSDPLTA